MSRFPEQFSADWDSQRSTFYEALFGPGLDDTLDLPTRLSLPERSGLMGNRSTIIELIEDLRERSASSHDLLSDYFSGNSESIDGDDKTGITQFLSDTCLVFNALLESFQEYGPPNGIKIELKRRAVGAPKDVTTVIKGMAVAAEIERRVAEGEQLEQVIRSMMKDPERGTDGLSEKHLRHWLKKRREFGRSSSGKDASGSE